MCFDPQTETLISGYFADKRCAVCLAPAVRYYHSKHLCHKHLVAMTGSAVPVEVHGGKDPKFYRQRGLAG